VKTTGIEILKSLNEYSSLILVLVTVVYVYFTYKMSKAMSRQILSDIEVSNIIIGSSLHDENIKETISKITDKTIHRSTFDFYARVDIFNKSAGPGSISKPILELQFSDGYIEKVRPETKSYNWKKIDANTSECETTDYGSNILVPGGGLETVELHYFCDLNNDLLEHLKNNTNPKYYIRYTDNRKKNIARKADNLISDDEFEEEYL
jgi:hypothetical protein